MRLLPLALALAVSSLAVSLSAPASAHEFWISPETYMIGPEDQLRAEIRVGQDFKGNPSTYLPQDFKRFELVHDGKVIPVEGRIGDRPALNMPAPGEGLVTVVYQTRDYRLTYTDPSKFVSFVTKKEFRWALAEHVARGLPEIGFKEVYSRHAKSLIAVGDGAGSDSEVGLLTEIVALANPYTDDLSGGLPVRVLYQGAPRVDALLTVFERAPDGDLQVFKRHTDAVGEAIVPVKPGHEYLLDAVVMRAADPETRLGAVWESLWASLTFMTPG